MIFGNFFATFFSYTYKAYGEDSSLHKPISDYTLTWAASIGGGFINGLSRLTMGYLQDNHSFRKLLTILSLISLVVSLSVYWVTSLPSLYFICILLNYFANGGLFAIFPGSVTNVFGLRFGPQVYTIIILANIVSSCLNILMTYVLLPDAGFAVCFYVGSLVTVFALIILWRFEERLDVENLKSHMYVTIK
jgi:MFS family permease